MNHNYLIPANSKKSMLILGFFTPVDLIIFGVGCTITLGLLFLLNDKMDMGTLLLTLSPALVASFLVMPVPNYHNVLQLITNIVLFVFGRKRLYWKGWCIGDEK